MLPLGFLSNMAFWNRFTGKKSQNPEISFGRYSDAYKSTNQYAAWDKSLKLYEEGKYLESIQEFVYYLENKGAGNITVSESSKNLFEFSLYQGSKQVDCVVNGSLFRAESKIAHCKDLNVGFLRKAVEYNYDLNYARFALDPGNNLCMLFDSLLSESSPYKLYYGLKELSIQSDKEDDLLLSEFEHLEPLKNQHIRILAPDLIKAKTDFIKAKLEALHSKDIIGSLNPKRYQGALTYVYLAAIYGLDYLVRPEGKFMEQIGNIHINYFSLPADRIDEKINILLNGIKELEEISSAEIEKELYEVISTFGITSPANQQVITQFIDSELQAVKWYEENKHDEVVMAICNYVAGYCMYNFALPGPDHDLMHLYFEIAEQDYFNKLGFDFNYRSKSGNRILKDKVIERVEKIMEKHRKAFPNLPFTINFEQDTLPAVLKSLLMFVKSLSLT
ncbi:MAG: hypothetical protein IPM34_03280 [Saprospiraceae bacterium]|nr:hypothetical protein [Saprospiraceae bacterium]